MRTVIVIPGVLVAALFLSACAARPALEARPGGNPAGVDLSGNWVLRGAADFPASREQTIVLPRGGMRSSQSSMQRGARPERSKGSSAHVFIESGKSLKITQTDYGLFISFDRAVVEEYNFGENSEVSVGPIEAQRVSGWEGDVLVVETMDEDGYVLTESWRLESSGDVLVRDIRIARDDDEKFSTRQVFDRS